MLVTELTDSGWLPGGERFLLSPSETISSRDRAGMSPTASGWGRGEKIASHYTCSVDVTVTDPFPSQETLLGKGS